MLKGDLLESQSWLRCSPTCVGQDVTPNSNLAGASLILYLNLLTHKYPCLQTRDRSASALEVTRLPFEVKKKEELIALTSVGHLASYN